MKKFLFKALGWVFVAGGVWGLINGNFEGIGIAFFLGFGLILFID